MLNQVTSWQYLVASAGDVKHCKTTLNSLARQPDRRKCKSSHLQTIPRTLVLSFDFAFSFLCLQQKVLGRFACWHSNLSGCDRHSHFRWARNAGWICNTVGTQQCFELFFSTTSILDKRKYSLLVWLKQSSLVQYSNTNFDTPPISLG